MSEQPPEIEGIVYVGEDGEAEKGTEPGHFPESKDAHLEGKVESLPPLTTAAALLADPLADIPREDADDETPPDPTPITDKRYGPKGTEIRDAWDRKQRERAVEAEAQIAAHPMVQAALAHDEVRLAQKAAIQDAFVKAQRKKT